MVSDASSGDGHKPPPHPSPLDQDPQHVALTQELARLLATVIAQRQAGYAGAGTPAGADLANLASLITSVSNQRTPAPLFKEGLSSLAYTPPRPSPPLATPEQHVALAPDDEPMPIPSTWREPPQYDEEGWFRQQVGAAALGLVAGLLIVVPTVLWLSGWLAGAQKSRPSRSSEIADARGSDLKPVKVQVRPIEPPASAPPYVTGSVEADRVVDPPQRPLEEASALSTVKAVEPAKPDLEELLAQAHRQIENGDIVAARETLVGMDANGQAAALFALAETYDPNMLAAWGSRGVSADVVKARALYQRALEAGVPRSQARLDALRQ